MKLNKNNLISKIWLYLIVFSVTILSILWLFQVAFLNTYYEYVKTKEVSKIATKIIDNYNSDNINDILDDITFDKGVCFEFISDDKQIYSSNSYSRGCIPSGNNDLLNQYKISFINSGMDVKSYKIHSKRFDNKTILYGIKLDNNSYVFINASLEPLGWATNILASQLVYVTIIVLVLSFIIAYFISKKISNPIIKINNAAKKMSKGEFNVSFNTGQTISEINELSTTLTQACEELSKTEELRREFLANVSHDLKTPLTMIKAYAEMVRDISYNNKEKRENDLNIIIDETNRLNLLVNDILDLSKIQSNVDVLNYEVFDLNLLIKNIIKQFSYIEDKYNYDIIYNNKEELMIKADKKRIEQVIYNLISNAINYVGKDNKILINVEKINNKFRVEVIDHGTGIDNKDIDYIWDKYYKIDKKYKRNMVGTGLGLSIVKNILIKHNIEFGVESKKNKGTKFYFEIDEFKENKD